MRSVFRHSYRVWQILARLPTETGSRKCRRRDRMFWTVQSGRTALTYCPQQSSWSMIPECLSASCQFSQAVQHWTARQATPQLPRGTLAAAAFAAQLFRARCLCWYARSRGVCLHDSSCTSCSNLRLSSLRSIDHAPVFVARNISVGLV